MLYFYSSNIDTEELCTYFAQHLGKFEAVFKAAEELNAAMNAALHSTAKVWCWNSC